MRMPDVPKVETVLLNRPNDRPLGAGEASQGPTGGGDRQRLRGGDRAAFAGIAVRPGAGESRARLTDPWHTRPRKFGGGRFCPSLRTFP